MCFLSGLWSGLPNTEEHADFRLRPPARHTDSRCYIVLIKRLAEQRLDDCLPANIQFLRRRVQFFQHR